MYIYIFLCNFKNSFWKLMYFFFWNFLNEKTRDMIYRKICFIKNRNKSNATKKYSGEDPVLGQIRIKGSLYLERKEIFRILLNEHFR